jgi:5-methylcytosine-specific restriction enzyme A
MRRVLRLGTGSEAGFNSNKQIEIALEAIIENGGKASIRHIFNKLESNMNAKGYKLSFQGEQSMRNFVNKIAVEKGLIYKHDKNNPGWCITTRGKRTFLQSISITKLNNLLPTEENVNNFTEGNVKQVIVNKYEREIKARQACVDFYGICCKACGLNFEKVYGEIGKDFIHVHHVVPVSEIGENYKINPIKDLIPLCANCHSMLHRTKPVMSVKKLKIIMQIYKEK